MIITTLTILFYSFSTIIILFLLGIGLTLLSIPDKLKPYSLWLSPWYAMFFLIFFLVIFSLFGLSVKQVSPLLIILLLFFDVYAIFSNKLKLKIEPKADIIILIFVLISILFNSSPLIRRVKILTTLSLGNNDVLIYASLPDYLVDYSIADNYTVENEPLKPTTYGVNGMIKDNFRWGSPIIVSFFLNIFQLKGYQYVYLFQLLLFGLTIPLIYLLFNLLYKSSFYGLLLSFFIFTFNVNLLYILYHDFLGQIFFWGIEVFLLIHLFSYFFSNEIKKNIFNKSDFIIGLTMSVLFFSYHEGVVLIIAPIFIFLLFNLITGNNVIYYLQTLIRIFFITGVTSFLSIARAVKIDFLQAGGLDAPIGWQLFRNKIPFANPFEALGFYSIHSFEPLPTILAILLSLFIILAIVKGVFHSKQKLLVISFLILYLFFYYWTGILHNNFFAYNRALTYTLPLVIVLFSIGTTKFYENNRKLGIIIIIFLIGAVLYSGVKLNGRFIREYLAVDSSLISSKELNDNEKINEPIFTEQTITGPTNLWRQFWTDYFLYPNKSIYTPFNINKTKDSIADESLILISKFSSSNSNPSKIIFNKIEWENEHYILGRLCNSDKCLLSRNEDLSKILVGKNEYEDSLLFSGWGIKEGKTRWANEKESTLRLVTKDIYPTNLTIEALSLGKPQKMTVYLDDQLLGEILISTEWKIYNLPINYILNPGVHRIKFVYYHGYRPMDVIPDNLDGRTLYVNFKKIALE
ncbi:MAG: hypothetical protein AAB437_00130 [Patescibacteria group bacterium]